MLPLPYPLHQPPQIECFFQEELLVQSGQLHGRPQAIFVVFPFERFLRRSVYHIHNIQIKYPK